MKNKITWVVTYDRHHLHRLHMISRFETHHFFFAWLMYQWWAFHYTMTILPVKQLSLYKTEDGVPHLTGGRIMFENRQQLRKLKYKKQENNHNKFKW